MGCRVKPGNDGGEDPSAGKTAKRVRLLTHRHARSPTLASILLVKDFCEDDGLPGQARQRRWGGPERRKDGEESASPHPPSCAVSDPRIHLTCERFLRRRWVAGSSPATTVGRTRAPERRRRECVSSPTVMRGLRPSHPSYL